MGVLEKAGRIKTRRKKVSSFVLTAIGTAGLIGVALVAPNVLGAMGKAGLLPGKRQKEIINRARDRLVRQGMLERDGKFLKLTLKGQRTLRLIEASGYRRAKQRRWDGKWRVLIFDIPEHRKSLRDKIRHTLLSIGFVRLQDSVWAFPYDCEDLIALLKADFNIGKDLLYLIVEEMEGDRQLKRDFGIH